MNETLVLDCIGNRVLTVAVAGAIHYLPVTTDIIRVCGVEQPIGRLPLSWFIAALGNKFDICDKHGNMVYSWRYQNATPPSTYSFPQVPWSDLATPNASKITGNPTAHGESTQTQYQSAANNLLPGLGKHDGSITGAGNVANSSSGRNFALQSE